MKKTNCFTCKYATIRLQRFWIKIYCEQSALFLKEHTDILLKALQDGDCEYYKEKEK